MNTDEHRCESDYSRDFSDGLCIILSLFENFKLGFPKLQENINQSFG